MNILQQIQADLLDQNTPLSTILRKAKVLASQLHSEELASWVAQELDGYKSDQDLPDYRVLRTSCVGKWTNGYWLAHNHAVPLLKIEDDRLKNMITTYNVYDGIRTVEQLTTDKERHFILSADITALVNQYVSENGYGYAEIEQALGTHDFEQVLDTVRNRLLDFILKLGENWHVKDPPPSKDKLRDLVSVIIYNQQGGNMAIFDQRGQQVQYQYNAAGNINIDAVQSIGELINELDKLREEVGRAKESKVLDQDVAVEAEYHLLQATKEAKKKKPDKGSFLGHIGKAKALLEDIATVAGFVTALLKVVEVANKLLY